MGTAARIAKLAAHAALMVEHGMTVGLGSGSTAEAVVRALGARVADGLRFTGVATSSRTAALARTFEIPLLQLDEVETLDLGIDGADEIDPNLDLVKGRGGALLWEKLTARLCEHWVVVASSEKLVPQLGTRMPLPVEIISFGARQTTARVEALGGKATLRLVDGGEPFVTDSGNQIIDLATGPILDSASFAYALKAITGVVDHGLFVDFADTVLTVDESGAIRTQRRAG
jgi:ribose 5-phosphate isomerase A